MSDRMARIAYIHAGVSVSFMSTVSVVCMQVARHCNGKLTETFNNFSLVSLLLAALPCLSHGSVDGMLQLRSPCLLNCLFPVCGQGFV